MEVVWLPDDRFPALGGHDSYIISGTNILVTVVGKHLILLLFRVLGRLSTVVIGLHSLDAVAVKI